MKNLQARTFMHVLLRATPVFSAHLWFTYSCDGHPYTSHFLPTSTGSSLFFRLRGFPASGMLPSPTHRAAWKWQGVNISRVTLTQWRKQGKSPSFSIPWWDSLTPQMASEGVREALTYAPLSVSLTLPLPSASPNHLPNKQPALKSLHQFLPYATVLFQCL